MIVYTAIAVLVFVIGLPGEAFFWAIDSVQMMGKEQVCRPADQTMSEYFVKGHWTEAPWRPVCKEE